MEEKSREILKKEFNGILSKNATEFTKTFTELMFEVIVFHTIDEYLSDNSPVRRLLQITLSKISVDFKRKLNPNRQILLP